VTLCGRPSGLDADRVDAWADEALDAGLIEPGVAQRVRVVARMVTGKTVSGQSLSAPLGVSRAAVHKHVEVLRSLGLEIRSVPGRGYSLTPGYDTLAPEVVLALLFGLTALPPGDTGLLGLPYSYLPSVPSTNAVLSDQLQAGARAGAVAVTEEQTAGRGRLGRTWVSERGKDVTFSVALRPVLPAGQVHLLVLAASVAVAETLQSVKGLAGRVGIKWPNDVLLDGRKVCGILAEASLDMDRIHWVVVGIGLNANGRPAARLYAENGAGGRPLPSSIAERAGRVVPRGLLLACLLGSLAERLTQVERGGWPAVRRAYQSLDSLKGSPVTVRSGLSSGGPARSGVARGIGPQGELLVEDTGGELVHVSAGEATLATD
jgi:BirA family biotin operon repressor/biotin-[acetyl-CoA-carboxylase] ligase